MAEETLDLPAEGVPVEEAPRGFAPGATIGHFRIVREVGAGGMGIVFEAYDPDLDRRVAIKILRDRRGQRLVAEAQAMAKLAHPHVVAVHEVGTVGDQFFVVMELVGGGTLGSWLAQPRSWRDIVRVYIQAGEGLVAAHDTGLVHGDFKPNNVLIDDAGRARVADFGLARTADDDAPHLATGSQPAGTPGYMAPEQIAGKAFDARADQYAFAVALQEALRDREVPRRITRALARALETDADQRFATLRELLAELRAASGTRRRAVIAAIGIAWTSAAVGVAIAWSAAPAADDCMTGATLVDDVWTDSARLRIAGIGPTTAQLVDEWVDAWRLGRRTACSAEPVQRPARVACLDGRLADLRAQLAVWQHSNRVALARSLPSAAALPSPESCAVPAAGEPISFPLVVQRIALVNALQRGGRAAEVHAQLPALLADAEATGDHATFASALFAAGLVERDVGKPDKADEDFRRSAREAAEINDTPKMLAAMVSQSAVQTDRGRPLEALGTLDAAASMSGRALEDPRAAAQLAMARSDALTIAGRFPEAIVEAKKGLAILEPIAERDHAVRVKVAHALGALAAAEGLSMHHEEAKRLLERCLAIEEADYGFDHPEIAKSLHDLANQEARLNDFDSARKHYNRARGILVATYGEKHKLVALVDYSLGGLQLQREHPADARPYFQRALAELLASDGRDHPDVARIEGALGSVERELNHCREALPHLERARQVVEHNGINGTELAGHLTNLGACLADVGRDAEARIILNRALAEMARAGTPEVERTEPHALLAEIEWRAGNRAHAIALAKGVIAATAAEPPPYNQLHEYMKTQLAQWQRR